MTEVRRGGEIPEDVRKQILPDGRPRVITAEIPDNIMVDYNKTQKKKQDLYQQMLSISVRVVDLEKKQKEIREKMFDNDNAVEKILTYAFKKLKLAKKKGYRWQFKKDSFIGVCNPPVKQPPKK